MMRKPSHSTPPTSGGKLMSSRIKSGFSLRADRDRLRAVQGRDDLIARPLQFQGDGFQDDLVVIHHQNFFWGPVQCSYQVVT